MFLPISVNETAFAVVSLREANSWIILVNLPLDRGENEAIALVERPNKPAWRRRRSTTVSLQVRSAAAYPFAATVFFKYCAIPCVTLPVVGRVGMRQACKEW